MDRAAVRARAGIAPSLIGLLILANAVTVVLAQLPIVRAAEGRSRVGALSLAAGLWVVACLLAVEGGFASLLAAAVAFAVGECLHATAFMPLIADLAPLGLRGRYMATAGLSWWLGLAVAPTLGGPLLAVSASLPLIGGAVAGGVGDRAAADVGVRPSGQRARDTAAVTSSQTARCRATLASRSVWTATMLVRSAASAPPSAARKPSTSSATS